MESGKAGKPETFVLFRCNSRREPAGGDLAGVERASQSLLGAVGSKRSVTLATPASDAERFLNMRGAEAAALGPEDILLRPNPSKAAVLEEFLHGTQQRSGVGPDNLVEKIARLIIN